MASIAKLIRNPAKMIHILDRLKIGRLIPDEMYLRIRFRADMGKKLNLKRPETYNEKLQWMKLYNRNPLYTKLVDKHEVKSYVAEHIGQEYLIPTLGIWDKVEDIDFAALPDQFVLKCTHDSGGIVICKDKSKLDIQETKRKLGKLLNNNFFYVGREWPYKDVKPCILAEAYLEDAVTAELRDYKFFCFNGVVKAMFVATERQKKGEEVKFDFYDAEYNHLPFRQGHPNAKKPTERPETYAQMIQLAEKLSQGLPHVRVDLYEVNGKNYFGELTFFHHDGFVAFEPEEWDYTFGSWLELPKV